MIRSWWGKTSPKDKRFLVAIVLLFLAAVYAYIFVWPVYGPGDLTNDQPLPSVEPVIGLVPTDIDSFMDSHGPWLSSTESLALREQSGVRNLALLRSNGLSYSGQSVAFIGKEPWQKTSTPPQITGVELRDTGLIVKNQAGDRYTLNITQPFMLEGNLEQVFVIDRDRQLWSANVADLQFVNSETVSDAGLPVNPNLSISL
jgi:hypothetical protein